MEYWHYVLLYAFCLICTSFTLFCALDLSMPYVKNVVALLWLPLAAAQNSSIDLGWYAPKKSWINDLGQVLNGTGTNGFVFNSSLLPAGTPYGTYNWCNMPHVRSQEYPKVDKDYKLQYVEV